MTINNTRSTAGIWVKKMNKSHPELREAQAVDEVAMLANFPAEPSETPDFTKLPPTASAPLDTDQTRTKQETAYIHPIERETRETETRVPNHEAVRKPIQLSECPATNSKTVAKLLAIGPSILLAGVEIQHVIYAFLLFFLSSLMQTQCLKKDNEKLETEILGRIQALELHK